MRFSRLGLFALAMSFFASCWFASAQPSAGRTFAYLVACGDYDPTELKPVPFTLHEMKQFRDVLIASGIPADNIVYLHDKTDKPGRFIPNRANILKEYKLLLERLRPEDSLIVALSGHGIQYKADASGYFCPLDAKLGPDHKKTLVALDGAEGLLTLLEKTKAQRKLVLVNACRNDPASNAFLAAEKLQLRDDYNEEPPKGTVVLFACSKGQRSYFYPDTEKREDRRNRSLFMYHVTEAWKGSYAMGKKVTLDHVLSEVRDRVEDEAQRDFRNNQMPLAKKKDFEGSWLLAISAKETPSGNALLKAEWKRWHDLNALLNVEEKRWQNLDGSRRDIKDRLIKIQSRGPALSDHQVTSAVYLLTMGRPPTDEEVAAAKKQFAESNERPMGVLRLAHSLVQGKEFRADVAAANSRVIKLHKDVTSDREWAKRNANEFEKILDDVTGSLNKTTAKNDDKQFVDLAYLLVVSRFPNEPESEAMVNHLQSAENRVTASKDLLWALLNTKEFLMLP